MAQNLLSILARIVVLIFSLSIHEWAHAFAAYKNGDPTARLAGRMTINPLAHLDPFGFVMLFFLPVAYAKPVPIDSRNFRHYRRGLFWTAIAGVLSNFLMAIVWMGALSAVATFCGTRAILANLWLYFVYMLAYYGVTVNLALMVFNLLPIYPLDGFRVIESTTRPTNRYRRFMNRYGRYILLGLLAESVLFSIVLPSIFGNYRIFSYLDILGFLMEKLTGWIAWPFERLWSLLWGLFV